MTNKERLDAIKGRAMFNQLAKRTGEITHSLVTLDEEDYDWLIEQVERVQGLKIVLEILGKQNKRLREALEFYSDERNWMNRKVTILMDGEPADVEDCPAIFDDGGHTARKALEGEE